MPGVLAVNCGDTLTTNTNLTFDCLSTGFTIAANGITLDCKEHTIASLMFASGTTGTTVKNCTINSGISLYPYGSSNSILNTKINGGIEMTGGCSYNTVSNSVLSGGIYIAESYKGSSNYNLIEDSEVGGIIIISSSHGNSVINSKIGGIYIVQSLIEKPTSTQIINDTIGGSGIYLQCRTPGDPFYGGPCTAISIIGNVVNASVPVRIENDQSIAVWNDAQYGNYWINPSGTGFSETCAKKAGTTNLCTGTYQFNAQNIDYMPLRYVLTFQPPVIQDADGDGIQDSKDNCVNEKNPDQADMDADGIGDVCDNCAACAGACCEEQYSTGQNLAPEQTLAINTGDAVLDMPENSVPTNISISLTKGSGSNFMICMPEAGECGKVVSDYTIGKVGQTFNHDYTLKLSYGDVEECSWGACEIWYSDDNGITWSNPWGPPAIEGGFLVISANHFSEYAIVKTTNIIAVLNKIAKPGDSINLGISLNANESGGFQFDLSLPSVLACHGYQLAQNLSNSHVSFNNQTSLLTAVVTAAGIYLPLISANEGQVMDILCNVGNSASEGSYPLDISNTIVGDESGKRISADESDGNLTIDSTPPNVTVIKPTSWTNSAAYVYLSCYDELSGCAQIKYGLASSGTCTADQTYQGSIEVPFEQYLCYSAKDGAGNTASGVELIDYFDFNDPNARVSVIGEICNY